MDTGNVYGSSDSYGSFDSNNSNSNLWASVDLNSSNDVRSSTDLIGTDNQPEGLLGNPNIGKGKGFKENLKNFGKWITASGQENQSIGGRMKQIAARSFAASALAIGAAVVTPVAVAVAAPIMVGVGIKYVAPKVATAFKENFKKAKTAGNEAFHWVREAPLIAGKAFGGKETAINFLNKKNDENMTPKGVLQNTYAVNEGKVTLKDASKKFISQRDAEFIQKMSNKPTDKLSSWEANRLVRIYDKYNKRVDIEHSINGLLENDKLSPSDKKELNKMNAKMNNGKPLNQIERNRFNNLEIKYDVGKHLQKFYNLIDMNSTSTSNYGMPIIENSDKDFLDKMFTKSKNKEPLSPKEVKKMNELVKKYSNSYIGEQFHARVKLYQLLPDGDYKKGKDLLDNIPAGGNGFHPTKGDIERLKSGAPLSKENIAEIDDAHQCKNHTSEGNGIYCAIDRRARIYSALLQNDSTKRIFNLKVKLTPKQQNVLNKFNKNEYLNKGEREILKKMDREIFQPLELIQEEVKSADSNKIIEDFKRKFNLDTSLILNLKINR